MRSRCTRSPSQMRAQLIDLQQQPKEFEEFSEGGKTHRGRKCGECKAECSVALCSCMSCAFKIARLVVFSNWDQFDHIWTETAVCINSLPLWPVLKNRSLKLLRWSFDSHIKEGELWAWVRLGLWSMTGETHYERGPVREAYPNCVPVCNSVL